MGCTQNSFAFVRRSNGPDLERDFLRWLDTKFWRITSARPRVLINHKLVLPRMTPSSKSPGSRQEVARKSCLNCYRTRSIAKNSLAFHEIGCFHLRFPPPVSLLLLHPPRPRPLPLASKTPSHGSIADVGNPIPHFIVDDGVVRPRGRQRRRRRRPPVLRAARRGGGVSSRSSDDNFVVIHDGVPDRSRRRPGLLHLLRIRRRWGRRQRRLSPPPPSRIVLEGCDRGRIRPHRALALRPSVIGGGGRVVGRGGGRGFGSHRPTIARRHDDSSTENRWSILGSIPSSTRRGREKHESKITLARVKVRARAHLF